MGFSNKVHSAVNFVKLQGLKKDEKQHYWEVDGERIDNNVFSARLVKIANDSYEYEGITRETIKMLFADGGDNYQLDISFNSLSRSMINTILGYIDSRKEGGSKNGKLDLEISLYMNKENYKSLGLYINGERGTWRINWETQKTLIKDIFDEDGVLIKRSFKKLDELLKKGVEEIQDYISITDFQEEIPKEEKQKFTSDEEISIEDLPF